MTNVIPFPRRDRDTCPRCGASEQGTHHPLCEDRDGTPSGLSDAEVRRRLHSLDCPHCSETDALIPLDEHALTCYRCGWPESAA